LSASGWADFASTAVGAVTPTYDDNGNLTFDGTFNFGYDAENRLTSASGAGNTASYADDAQGRRKTRTVNGTTTVFVTDAANREVLEYDGATGAILRWYAYGLGSNDVLNQINVAASTRTTLMPDIQGSIIASLDSTTGALSKIGYLPYGKSASAGPFGYTGQRIDTETNGIYYYRARHYSPLLGRFMQADPIGYSGGVNLCAYVGNDPLNHIDSSGNCPPCVVGGLLNVGIGYGITRLTGQEYGLGSAAVDSGIGFATSEFAVPSAARRGAQIVEGVYAFEAQSGLTYVGQTNNMTRRFAEHVADGKATQSAVDVAQKFEILGGQISREVAEQAAIDARGGVANLEDVVNPIGGRPWLSNQAGLGTVTRILLIGRQL
jgi:RHS repeat-associated protein